MFDPSVSDRLGIATSRLGDIRTSVSTEIIGQESLIIRLLVAFFASGHALIEGVPGLGKTRTVSALARALNLPFGRVSFTPDLLPADIVGTEVWRAQKGEFTTRFGPVFTGLLLADEINRAPAKTQSALLEAMQEGRVTIGSVTHALPDPFFVLATQNPLDQEGTYPLPEAQLDRFLLNIIVDYPERDEELAIMRSHSASNGAYAYAVLTGEDEARALRESIAQDVYVDERIYRYVADIVFATRSQASTVSQVRSWVRFGASPRASIAFIRAAKVLAALSGRAYVLPEDIKSLAHDILRHRIGLSFEALGEGITTDQVIDTILSHIIVP